MLRLSDDSLTDIIEIMVDNDYCPNGPQVDGCPVDDVGLVLLCERCWESFFEEYGEKK